MNHTLGEENEVIIQVKEKESDQPFPPFFSTQKFSTLIVQLVTLG